MNILAMLAVANDLFPDKSPFDLTQVELEQVREIYEDYN
jgi:hypothetical protein